ncbi:MAG: YdcF family protein [Eubacteriales bacterium]|nr:YdcF family protein [Eubacteriales bacterium]
MDRKLELFQESITEFIFVNQKPEPADIIFVPGNGYPQMAERAAGLWKNHMAPLVLPSGRYSVTRGHFAGVMEKEDRYGGEYETEWEFLSHVLTENGVPQDCILREDRATFTYENAIYSRQVTDCAELEVQKAIICCKSHHARRCLMYFQLLYPQTEFLVCPSDTENITRENWHETEKGIEEVMGEADRIIRQFNLMMK